MVGRWGAVVDFGQRRKQLFVIFLLVPGARPAQGAPVLKTAAVRAGKAPASSTGRPICYLKPTGPRIRAAWLLRGRSGASGRSPDKIIRDFVVSSYRTIVLFQRGGTLKFCAAGT